MKEYIINNDTVVVSSIGFSCCMVYEINKSFIVNKSLKQIIKKSCKHFGSSFDGRIEGSKYLIGYNYKMPIILDEYKNIIFFPLKSYRSNNNSIVLLNNIKDFIKIDKNVEIILNNNEKILLNISYGIFERQYIKAQKLCIRINQIKNI